MAYVCKRGLLHSEKEIVTYATTQTKLEGIVGGETHQPQKAGTAFSALMAQQKEKGMAAGVVQ